MRISTNDFKVCEGAEVDLGRWATNIKDMCKSKKAYRNLLEDQVDELNDQLRLL